MNKTKKEILAEILEEFRLNLESKLYRYTSVKYIDDSGDESYLKAKTECSDIVIDHYDDKGHFFVSQEMGKGISFLSKPEPDYERDERICVEIQLKDVIDQGGLIYKITSLPAYLKGYFVTLPSARIKVNIK
ncbi:hypothetical protein [Urechidicola vernalis]|uniref:Uncharacterized protein n=1 Tax=Urechidicola vernalis TaxID=3075600 RepID=A0ABU2Y1M3_9FLAO|nr:hypothetical protein [Urechidicola sp. P050]MDT0552096.1 hypothetical protein [Urechidicola sp. P050]